MKIWHIVILAIGGFLYWYGSKKQKEAEERRLKELEEFEEAEEELKEDEE